MADGESLESWLNKATSPSNRQEDWEFIMGFCDQINKELEGPQISVRLLAHKVQSPQEWEAMQALTVLEACMKNCGQRFHNEVGKFRFLNELIKVVSPKYLGDKVSEKVKSKVIELLYSWTVSLPDEAKVLEAYAMLKSQGIVVVDPEIPLDATLIPSPSPRPKNPVFDDDKKSKRLAELLKSKKPEDLQEANRLIKNMVKEDEARAQKEKKLKSTLEAVNSSVRLLNEMLEHFSPEDSTDGDKELIRELHSDCDKLRQTVCQLATEAEDNDSSLGEILQANDDLALVIDSYKKVVAGHISNGGQAEQSEILIDLEGLDFQVVSPPSSSHLVPAESQSLSPGSPSAAVSLLDEELLSLGLNDPAPIPSKSSHLNLNNHLASSQDSSRDFDFFHSTSPSVSSFSTSWLFPDLSVAGVPVNTTRSSPGSVSSTPPVSVSSSASFPQTSSSDLMISAQPLSTSAALSPNLQDLVLLDLDSPKPTEDLLTPSSPGVTSTSTSLVCGEIQTDSPESRPLTQDVSLTNVFVPLDAIKPSKVCPVTAYDNNGVQVLLHFASECPAGRPDVLVMVVSMLNTAPLPVRNVALQAAVPKTMKVRLQAPTGTELAPFNPILPPAAITQVMLLSNPLKEKVRMRYKLTFTLGERLHSEVGEVSEFPPADCWGAL